MQPWEQEKYCVIRSRRRTVALQVTPGGRLVVRAPLSATDEEIRQILARHTLWIERAKVRSAQRRDSHPEPTAQEEALLRQRAKEEIPTKVAHYGALMGVQPAAVHITSARTRFGSCSAKNSVNFSWRLMQYPEEAVDYVVVHELAHIRHHNHSRAFYEEVERILPDYRQRAALLRK